MNYVENTRRIVEREGIDAEIREHERWGKRSEVIAELFDMPLKHVIKSLLVFLDDAPSLAVLPGDTRLDLEKIEKKIGKKSKLARAKDIKELGFAFGGIPCIGSGLPVIVDEKILSEERVVGSAGSPYVGIDIRPKDLVRLNDAEVLDICTAV